MVVASVGVSQAIFFSSTTRTTRNRTRTPSRFDLQSNNPPTSLVLDSPFSLQTNSSRRNRTSHCCRCTPNSNETSLNWDWNRWCRHFSEIEQAESFASVLKFQLEDAIEKEDFQEATKLKRAIVEATSKDSVAEIMSQLKNAIDDERYHDASKLCRYTGSGLVGWWVGYSKDSENPFGRIIRISPGMGRFVGKSYSPRQLLSASTGTPIFEIYVVKNGDDTYHMQVVYLRRDKRNSMKNPPSIPAKILPKPEIENASSVDVQEHEEKVEEKNDEKSSNIEAATEEGIKSVINFLKEKIPGLKVKVMNVNVEEEAREGNDSIKQFLEEDGKTSSSENSEEEVNNLDEPDEVNLEDDVDASEEEKDLDMKLFIGGVIHNNEESAAKDEFIRLPAEIKNMERDSFVFHIPKKNLDYDRREDKVRNIKVAALAAQGMSELMPSDIAKAFWSSDKVSSKVSKSMREIVKLAVSQAQKNNKLSEDTYFSRITSPKGDFDPFDGLYVGAFGPYDIEIVQLRRKFGHWNDADNENSSSDMKFFEYVEAVKLTGDLNVPAGQVTFRAKIGKVNRNANRGMYPDELGVVGEGTVMPMPDIKDKMPERSFLPRSILTKLPFSTSKIPELKKLFKASDNGSMEKMMRDSLEECERVPSRGETKRCVGSIEDMIDFATSVLGRNVVVRTTENLNGSKKDIMVGRVQGINGGKVTHSVSCHQSLFPYLLYYCHSLPNVRVYQADLLDPKTKVKINHGVSVCHLDTSDWSPTHGAFLALGSGPGRIEVCHWIFENDMSWTVAD